MEWEVHDFFHSKTGQIKQRIMVGIDSMKCDYLLKTGLDFDSDEEAEAYGWKVMPSLPIAVGEVHKNMARVDLEAVAPELFDALEGVVELLEMLGVQDSAATNKAYAALAKAKGGEHG